jgi:predicted ABC-type ATPase
MARPVLFVLAGVNGAGKSSIGGYLLRRQGLDWYNPDTFARELARATGCEQDLANARAWAEGLRRLDQAIAELRHYAFETTLGGRTIPTRIAAAARTHDVHVWFCGLDSPERHMARVRARVAQGGHDIPEARIRQRYVSSLANLIALMPRLAHLRVYDNSKDAPVGGHVPDPALLLEVDDTQVVFPAIHDRKALSGTPDWAKPIVEAALSSG